MWLSVSKAKLTYIIGAVLALACIGAICLGHDGEIKAVLGTIVGYLFGKATN